MLGALPVVFRSLISTVLRKWSPNYRPLMLSFLSLYVGEGYFCAWSHSVIDTSQSVVRIWARVRPLLSFLASASKQESDEYLSSFLILYFICYFSLISSLFRRVYILLLCLWKFFRLFDPNPRATGKPVNRSSLNFVLGYFASTRAATWIVSSHWINVTAILDEDTCAYLRASPRYIDLSVIPCIKQNIITLMSTHHPMGKK